MALAYLILQNGNLLTMDAAQPKAQAVAVARDGRILAVGTDSQVGSLADAATRVIDLRGRTLLPGFFDCHMHILWLGINLGHVDLSSPPVKDKEDIVRLLRERLEAQPDLTCVQGNRYNQNALPGGQHVTRYDLDRVSAEVPVRIVHTSGHAAVVNSKALERLGITRDTPDPVGGEIVRDARGEPTGVLLETASWNDLDKILPEVMPAEAVEALGRANRYLLERGITSASDANTEPSDVDLYRQAVERAALQVRATCMINWAEVVKQAGGKNVPGPDDLQPTGLGINWHRLHVGQAKLFSDGAITTRTCWLSRPFEGMPDNFGMPLHPPDELRELIRLAHNAGWQIATHAIGDRAINLVLSAYAEAQRQRTRHRPGHRIEHCMLLDDELIMRLRRQNIWSIGQPEFILRLGDAYVMALGEERANRLSPYASLDAHNVAQAFSSDCPVVPGAPLDGLRAALERKTPGGRILNAAERLSAEAALYAYTAAPAYATRTERDRGSIEAGKWADFALLTADPTATPVDEWERVRVEATFVGGECLYGGEALD
ncbi:MAG TPA: amidohydrolase [Chthonomonadaceae bacterium]|nr:amidohydrolase [Chthonomonadaceae bacterium]